jgi:hypothetical protein
MTAEQVVLTMIRGVIAELPTEQQAQVKECAAELRATIAKYRDYGTMAIGLVGAEMQVTNETHK